MTGRLDVAKFLKTEGEGSIWVLKSGMQDRDIAEQDVTKYSGISLQSVALLTTNLPYKYVWYVSFSFVVCHW